VHGKPVLSTTIGAGGIEDLWDEEEILLRDAPAPFAEACIQLLKDRNLAARIGQAARSVVARKYDRNNVVNRMRMCLSKSGDYCG
jgi:polysaccharide biosynthesis protein PslH